MKKLFLNKMLKGYSCIPVFSIFIIFLAFLNLGAEGEKGVEEIKGSLSLEAVSRDWGVPTSYLIAGLKLPKDVPLNLAFKDLKDRHGFTIEDVRKLVADYWASGKPAQAISASSANQKGVHRESEKKMEGITLPLVLYGFFCVIALFMLRGKKITNLLALCILVPSLIIFGLFFRANPEPMRAIVQFFQSLVLGRYSLQTTFLIFLSFALMTFIGVKLVCGWGCPAGSLQEFLYRLPFLNSIKMRKVPFWISNSVRVLLFACFIILLFGFIFGAKDQSLYRYFNPFKLFEWNFRVTAPIFVILIFGVSLLNYRPYCLFVCLFSLFSWLIQDLSIFKVRINRSTCLECGKCARACPSGAAQNILEGKIVKADCFACGRCINVCPNSS